MSILIQFENIKINRGLMSPECRLVKLYESVRDDLSGLATNTSQYLIPGENGDGQLVPIFDPDKTMEVRALYQKMETARARLQRIRNRIDEIDTFYLEVGTDSVENLARSLKALKAVAEATPFESEKEAKQKKYFEVEAQIKNARELLNLEGL